MKPLIWTRKELQYLVDTIKMDPEYGRSLLETAFYRIADGSIKFDYWGSGILDKWEQKEKAENE